MRMPIAGHGGAQAQRKHHQEANRKNQKGQKPADDGKKSRGSEERRPMDAANSQRQVVISRRDTWFLSRQVLTVPLRRVAYADLRGLARGTKYRRFIDWPSATIAIPFH